MEDQADRVWKVLIVDDNEGFCRLSQKTLETRGIAVCVAFSAESAKNEMTQCAIGMIVMDIHLSGMGGLTFAQDVRRADPYIPILFVSADTDALAKIKTDDWIDKGDKEFNTKLIRQVREEMPRYVTRYEAQRTGREIRKLIPRIDKLERGHVVTGEVIKSHSDQLDFYSRATGKAALFKQILVAVLGVASPVIGAMWYLTKDVAREQVHEIVNIAPMRAELTRAVKTLDALVADRALDRQERLQQVTEQRVVAAKQDAIQSNLNRLIERLPAGGEKGR